jgi:chromate transporter
MPRLLKTTYQTFEELIEQTPMPHPIPFRNALKTWVRIAALSFGGPAGQIAVMHRILVDEKRWVGEQRFLHALSYCTLLPGPEAQQLTIYIGWLMHGIPGGLAAGTLFVLPGAICIGALSALYAALGQLGTVAALFFGLKAAVLAIVLQAVHRLGKRALGNRARLAVAAAAFLAIFALGIPFPLIIFGAGAIGWAATRAGSSAFQPPASPPMATNTVADRESLLGETRPVPTGATTRAAAICLVLWLTPTAILRLALGPQNTFTRIATFFSEMAVVTFGGAYAVLAYVAQQAVTQYHWLRPGEMLDGLALAETTPGPLIMVTQFVGFLAAYRDPGTLPPLAAGTLGGLLTIWVTFTPCFLWIFAGAPYIEMLRNNQALTGALAAITAAVVGVILNLAAWFAVNTWFPGGHAAPWAIALSVGAIIAIFRFGVGVIPTLLGCAGAGMAIHLGQAS